MAPSNQISRRSFLLGTGGAAASLATMPAALAMDRARPFYAGKTVELVTPYATGGSNDIAARFLAPLLSKTVAGNPRVQVINMPGAETIVGSNDFERRKRDGQTWFLTGSSTTFLSFLKNENAKFSLIDWIPLIGFPQGSVNYGSKSLGIKDARGLDKTKEPLILAAQGTDGSSILRILGLHLLGVKYKLIPGYEGTGAKRTALLQGEITINGEGTVAYNKAMRAEAEAGNIVPLYSYGFLKADGTLARDPGAPDFPTVAEVYEWLHGAPPKGELWEVYKGLVLAQSDLQKSFFMHKKDPPEAIAAVRAGVEAAMALPEWAKAKDTVFEGYDPFTKGVEQMLPKVASPDPALINVLFRWLAEIGFPRK